MKISSLLIIVGLTLVVASCGSTESTTLSADAKDSPTSSSTTSIRPLEPTETDDVAFCGTEMPVFAAELDRADRLNVDGSVGPGPDSISAVEGQLITHWLGEYANYELRWPPALSVEGAWSDTVAGLLATEPEVGEGRARITIQLDESGDRCSLLSAEVYGPRVDPLFDEIYMFAGSLRPRSQLAPYLEIVNSEREHADGGVDRPPGECADPIVVTEVDAFGRPSEEVAAELVGRFMRDRFTGRRAQECLTVSALNTYSEPSEPELCFFECGNGAALTGPQPPVLEPFGSSDGTLVLAEVQLDGPTRTYREQLEVRAVEQPDGTRVALIANVVAFPESFVDADRAQQLVDDFLIDLADGDYDSAATLLVNEGYSQDVQDALGDVYGEEVADLLRDFCRTALCNANYTILRSTTPHLFRAVVEVQFDTRDGPIADTISVGSFEGQLSIGSLPPTAP